MSDCTLVSKTDSEIVVRHAHTGHEFTYEIVDGGLMLAAVKEGAGPKDAGDVAADAHAFARQETKRHESP